jgi:hypothetical protein
LQLISPENVPGHMGFSPVPNPKLIATFPTSGPAVAVSRGLDRDRVVDETGNQTVVFGRRGSRPFHLEEMQKLFRHEDGEFYKVEDVLMKKSSFQTRTGIELKPTSQFHSEEVISAEAPSHRERLERRGN